MSGGGQDDELRTRICYLSNVRGLTDDELRTRIRETFATRHFRYPDWLASQPSMTAEDKDDCVRALRETHQEYLPMKHAFIHIWIAILRERKE